MRRHIPTASIYKPYLAPKKPRPKLIYFADVPVGQFFWFQGQLWKKVPNIDGWNARAGEQLGQFEANELVG
jgi:hypothetical protein